MVVFVGNLPRLAAEKDLCQLARIPSATPVRIIKKTGASGQVQRYALIPVATENRARRLITRLQGLDWRGQMLVAHACQHRIAPKERRRIDWRRQPWPGVERRRDERRCRSSPAHSMLA